MNYGTTVGTRLPLDQPAERTRVALADQGVGVLTEITVPGTVKEELGEAATWLGAALRAVEAS